jgi:uncharacterized membrane-anchored protein
MEGHGQGKAKALRLGVTVLIVLAVLTAVEFAVSAALNPALPYLALIALGKAYLILRFFMHLGQLWDERERAP